MKEQKIKAGRLNLDRRAPLPARIWRSKLSWKIAAAVFVTILVIQGAMLTISVPQIEQQKLDQISKSAIYAIAPMIEYEQADGRLPLNEFQTRRIMTSTHIRGLAIYALDLSTLGVMGETTILNPRESLSERSYRSVDGNSYEVLLSPAELGRPFQIVVRMDAQNVGSFVKEHIKQELLVMLLLSGFVTVVLMIALSQWLLEPIFFLRRNLIGAMNNPEHPDVVLFERKDNDELSTVIRITNDLIQQNAKNIVEVKSKAKQQVDQMAYFDKLTGLPNRSSFEQRLDKAIKSEVLEKQKKLAIISIDLDHFKDINDTLGHDVGDLLLKQVAQKISSVLPEGAVAARASADEFMVMAPLNKGDEVTSSQIAQTIYRSLQEPIHVLQEKFQVRTSIGVAHSPEDGVESKQLIKNSDIALNRAKQEGRDTIRYYSEDFDKAVQQRFQMMRDMREALQKQEFLLNYQPQFDLMTGELIGAEALIRWFRKDASKEGGHFISPAEFIPLAEQSGMIVEIGEWVLREACAMNMRMRQAGLPKFRIAVNISGAQFHKGDIVNLVSDVLKTTGLESHLLELEVTESAFMENTQGAIKILHELHSLGVELAVDDFGTGYSSLSYLRQFPIDRLKIDQSFVRNALSDNGNRSITRTIITLGHSLDLKVIAEGVESIEQEIFLKEEGCDEVQGYRYSRPLPEEKFASFIGSYQSSTITGNVVMLK